MATTDEINENFAVAELAEIAICSYFSPKIDSERFAERIPKEGLLTSKIWIAYHQNSIQKTQIEEALKSVKCVIRTGGIKRRFNYFPKRSTGHTCRHSHSVVNVGRWICALVSGREQNIKWLPIHLIDIDNMVVQQNYKVSKLEIEKKIWILLWLTPTLTPMYDMGMLRVRDPNRRR